MKVRRFDRFTFDMDTGELRKGDAPIKLHPQPAALLTMLVDRPGEIVSREEIQKQLWPDDTFVDYDASINSCIRQIRTALGDDAEKPRFVETVPKKGYRFVAPVETTDKPPRRTRWLLPTAATIAIALAVWLLWPSGGEDIPEETPKPSIAVLYFENASGDPELDWLRTGLTEMLVTDLSQISDIDVLSTNRLFQILKRLDQQDAPVFSSDVVREVSERAHADTVILGSFMKAVDRIRINLQIQDPSSMKILTTERVEGTGDENLFSMADDLSLRVRGQLGMELVTELRRTTFEQSGTNSIDAFRYRVEATKMVMRGKSAEALAFHEKAIQVDPGFAEAIWGASIMHSNLGHQKEAREYANRALTHMDRLEPRKQASLEAWTYSMREETYGLAIEACKKAIGLNPGALALHQWMARRLLLLERLDEAIEHWEGIGARKRPSAYMHQSLANAYSLRGDPGNAQEVMREYIAMFPNRSAGYGGLGEALAQWGHLDEALEMFQKQENLSPGHLEFDNIRFEVFLLREAWHDAEASAQRIEASSDPTWKWQSRRRLATIKLFHGKTDIAVEHLNQAILAYEEPSNNTAQTRNEIAYVLLAQGEAARALDEARKAQVAGEGQSSEWEGIFLESLSLGQLGRMDEAEKAADKLLERTAKIPTEKEKRRHHHLLGELALIQGDTARALLELEQAQSMLLPRGFPGQHVPIWFSLATSYLEADKEEKALEWFHCVVESTNEHVGWPIPYVRSFYFLGKIHEGRGETEQARESYQRFYDYWKDGDLDRERIEEAR